MSIKSFIGRRFELLRAHIESFAIVQRIKNYFLNDDEVSDSERDRVLVKCEQIFGSLKDITASKSNNPADFCKHIIMSTDVFLANVVSVLELNKSFLKKRLFLVLLWLQNIKDFFLHGFFSPHFKREANFSSPSAKTIKSKKIDTAFICSFPTYLSSFIDIFRELETRKERYLLIVPKDANKWPTLPSEKEFKHLTVVYFEDFFDSAKHNDFLQKRKYFNNLFKSNISVVKKICSVGGINFFFALRPAFRVLFGQYYPVSLCFESIASDVFKKFGTKRLIVAKIRKIAENTFVKVAKELHVKVIRIEFTLFTDNLKLYYDHGNFVDPDLFIAWSERQKAVISRMNSGNNMNNINTKTKAKVKVLGNPQFSKALSGTLDFNCKKKIGFSEDDKLVFFATQHILMNKNYIKTVINSCNEAGFKVVLKTHPRQNKSEFDYLRGISKVKVFDNKELEKYGVDVYSLIASSDVLITFFSTIAFESLIIGTPIILFIKDTFRFSSMKRYLNDLELNDACAYSVVDLREKLLEVKSNKLAVMRNYQHIADDMLPADRVCSIKRYVDVILSVGNVR